MSNPIDMLGSAVGVNLRKVLPHLLGDPAIDAVIALFVPPVMAGADEVAAAIVRAVEAEGAEGKPVLVCVISPTGLRRRSLGAVAPFSYPESAARALGRAAERAEWLRRPQGRVPELGDIDRPRVARSSKRVPRAGSIPIARAASSRPTDCRSCPSCCCDSRGPGVAARARVSGRRQDCGSGRAQDRKGGVAVDLRDSEAVNEAARDRRASSRPADVSRRGRVPSRCGSRPRLRATRCPRAGRYPRRADR